jgi:hypothetical protein
MSAAKAIRRNEVVNKDAPGSQVLRALAIVPLLAWSAAVWAGDLHVQVSWGHRSPAARTCYVRFDARDIVVTETRAIDVEPGDSVTAGVFQTMSGGGDVDGAYLRLAFEDVDVREVDTVHSTWAYLLEHGDAGAARRLKQDPAYRPDSRKLTIYLNKAGTRGFSLTA